MHGARKMVGMLAATATAASGLAVWGMPPATAAATDVVINEMMFHALPTSTATTTSSCTTAAPTPVDLSGWWFAGSP